MNDAGSGEFSAQEFRMALGEFATGITVVTAPTSDGPPVGFTVNSFSSVSLNPPLILFSVARDLNRFAAMDAAEAFAVNVLTADQEHLSNQFASSDGDKWLDVAYREGEGGCPILSDTLATFECVPWAKYDGGDHVIFVGEVRRFARSGDAGALLYFRSRYAEVDVARD